MFESIKKFFSEFNKDFTNRLRNPLIFSFVLVFVFQFWSLLLMIFNLNENFTFGEKTIVIRAYLNSLGLCNLIFKTLFNAFVSLLFYYLIAIIASVIKLIFAKKLPNLIFHVLGDPNYIRKDEKAEVERILKDKSRDFEELNVKFNEASNEIKQLKEFIEVNEDKISSANEVSKKFKKLEDQNNKLIIENQNLLDRLTAEVDKPGIKNIKDLLQFFIKDGPITMDTVLVQDIIFGQWEKLNIVADFQTEQTGRLHNFDFRMVTDKENKLIFEVNRCIKLKQTVYVLLKKIQEETYKYEFLVKMNNENFIGFEFDIQNGEKFIVPNFSIKGFFEYRKV